MTFVESRGDDAASQLDALATHLAAHGWPARRLRHVEDAGVQLLTVEGNVDLGAVDTRGMQVWQFVDLAPDGRLDEVDA